jgi:hypothetical protein
MKPISYTSDQASDYNEALPKCKSLAELTRLLESYHTIFPDALQAAPRNADQFEDFMAGLRKERRGKFAGAEFMQRFGAVLLPELMIHVGMVAQHFHAPWGCAFLRLKDFKRIQFDDGGVARWVPETPNV